MTKQLKNKDDQLPSVKSIDDLISEDAGKGLEEVTMDCCAIPMISILQPQSDPLKQDVVPEHIKEGLIYDSITQQTYNELYVIPVYFERRFIEWIPRDLGGGLVNVHLKEVPGVNDKSGKIILENKNEVVDTRIHYVLVLRDGVPTPAMMSLYGTNVKVSKNWIAQMRNLKKQILRADGSVATVTEPTFSRIYKLTVEKHINNKGKWYTWVPTVTDRAVSKDEYLLARSFNSDLKTSDDFDIEGTLKKSGDL